MKYLYYPKSRHKLIPQTVAISWLVGERIYAVDRDTASVANLDEVEKSAISLSAQWRVIKSVKVLIVGHRSKFMEQTYGGYQDYFQQSLWMGFVTQW